MKNLRRTLMATAALAAGCFALQAQASVVIASTRVIYPAQEREVTIKLSNDGRTPALIQSWLDDGNITDAPEKLKVPFMLTPAIFRVDPGKGQTLRLIHTKEAMVQDKESLYWLNVLEVPPKAQAGEDANRLQIAFRTRIKVMYRPQGLPGLAEEAPAQLRWEVAPAAAGKGYALKASNPTPYVVNLGKVSLQSGGQSFDAGAGYVKPGESALFPIAGMTSAPAAGAQVKFNSINDWGANVEGSQPLTSGAASAAR
ncbi:molecular chaperone [Achromobacter xylosoxidans]|uniref:Molecular chaperone n=1 Tax=Alcaligenes xylosoxydans xylosoxydans TaxID=85698 RepID=A0A424WJU4_ALCXX|nr:fimbria/pilus periplasmic chaperone [Achromobacter xylosoxidans]MBC9904190.1 fimbria/pilus periplasmic chaperone [Achromobacter xylosoxidans]MBD0867851.1 fimbria/pilus periplasmic chaperone [Achromobacter xylosoxidans]QNP86514.1 fimbria/pilus periplasmic chaperone [Achromobacter xylosoxidans]RPJ93459.1 molecular chaperone [Achromobacter xylosoxidans]